MEEITISNYLLARLQELGIQHIFGVPGDYNLKFLDSVVNNKDIQWIGTCNELNAAYAADGYARVKGAGVLATTFGVGELSAINGIAGSYAEFVPVVQIVGTPSLSIQTHKALVHHSLGNGDFTTFANMYNYVSVAQALLTPENATTEIDHVLRMCWLEKRPVYIALPADISELKVPAPQKCLDLSYPASDNIALQECIERIVMLVENARNPIIIADICTTRHSICKALKNLLNQTGILFATRGMGKGIINESHPQYVGIYNGNFSSKGVQELVETSDCVISFGSLLSDLNTGGFTAKLKASSTIEINSNHVIVKYSKYDNLYLNDIIVALTKSLKSRNFNHKKIEVLRTDIKQFRPAQNIPITHAYLWQYMSQFWQKDHIIIAETGSALFGSLQLKLPDNAIYICQLLWASIGYTVGALLGSAIADIQRRSILLIGDGSFQFTAQELSTIMRHNLNPIICLINNDGYTVERAIHGQNMEYNDIKMWQYAELPKIFGGNFWSTRVTTEIELATALKQSLIYEDKLVFIEIIVEKLDMPSLLCQVAKTCAKQNL